MLAKSKLNNTEKWISKALIDLEISHEEYKSIINEEDNYRRIKQNIRMINSDDELNEKEDQKKKKEK